LVSDKSPDSRELLNWGRAKLKSAGIEDCDISAEILLREALGLSRAELLTNIDFVPNHSQAEKYRKFIDQRSRRMPLQYITRLTEFYNVFIKCDPRALIPRPETEILVETVIRKLKHLEFPSILDIGTGSGNIAIALAKNIDGAQSVGVDISEKALELARSNATLNGVSGRSRFVAGDISDVKFVESLGHFDCVVSNPPYVSEAQKDMLQPEVIEFEPKVALFSPGNPLRFFEIIVGATTHLLREKGVMAFEVGLGQAGDIKKMMLSAGFESVEISKDLAGRDRVITAIRT